jgi:predicted transcriptional regulator
MDGDYQPRPDRSRRTTTPVTDEEIAEMVRLHGDGVSVRAIADQLELSQPTVSKYLRLAGVGANEEYRERLTKARSVKLEQLAQDRVDQAIRLSEAKARMIDQLSDKYTTSGIVGNRGFVTGELEEPGAQDKAHLSRAIGAIDTMIDRVLNADNQTSAEMTGSLLGSLMLGISAQADAIEAEDQAKAKEATESPESAE